jgi:hypothetical protein
MYQCGWQRQHLSWIWCIYGGITHPHPFGWICWRLESLARAIVDPPSLLRFEATVRRLESWPRNRSLRAKLPPHYDRCRSTHVDCSCTTNRRSCVIWKRAAKALARKKIPAAKISRSLKRTVGATRQQASRWASRCTREATNGSLEPHQLFFRQFAKWKPRQLVNPFCADNHPQDWGSSYQARLRERQG